MSHTVGSRPVLVAGASNGSVLLMASKSTANGSIQLPALSNSIIVRAREDACKGNATMSVSIDGGLAITISTTSTAWANYTIAKSYLTGVHSLKLSFTNDYYLPGTCDRNLYIDRTVFTAPVIPAPLGINTCCGGSTEETRLLATGAKIIRTDRNDYEISFAHAHGIKVDGIIWLDDNSPGMASDIVELDNEPYFNNWDGLGGPAQWAVKARDVAKAVKAVYPTKPVLLPMLGYTNNGDVYVNGTWQPLVTVINQAAPDIWQYIDGVAIHPYTRPSAPNFTVMNHVRSELTALGAQANKPFWVTEIGWPTGGTDGSAVSEALQAQYLGQFIDTTRVRSDIAAVLVFKASDNTPSTSSEAYYGLYRNDGTQKPSFNVFLTRQF